MAAALNDFAAARRDLNDSGIRYVIVDGRAVIRHGAVRATKDVDAAVAMDGDNLARLERLVVLARADFKRIDGVEAPICSFSERRDEAFDRRSTDLLDLERLREAHGELPEDEPPK